MKCRTLNTHPTHMQKVSNNKELMSADDFHVKLDKCDSSDNSKTDSSTIQDSIREKCKRQ